MPAPRAAYERGRAVSAQPDNRISFDASTEARRGSHHGHCQHAPSAYHTGSRQVRRRRSSVGMAIDAIRDAGGVNSLGNFAASWQRAVGFHQVTPVRPGFRYADDDDARERGEEEGEGQEQREHDARDRDDQAIDDAEEATPSRISRTTSRATTDDRPSQTTPTPDQPLLQKLRSQTPADDSILSIEPSLESPFGGSYGSTWGSLSSRANASSMRHAGRLFRQQQRRGGSAMPDKERQPLMVKRVEEDDGKVVNVVVGQSTLPQTVFNSVNVLIGIGLLALPLAMKYAGWIPGLIFFFFAGISTCYTAKLLAKCADVDGSLITFADLAYVSFGPWARIFTSILFVLELVAACVALVVLFSDSLHALTGGAENSWPGVTGWKVVCGIILIPLSFVPLRYLSFTSILGILCCFGIVLSVLVDGLIKPSAPGSLREPARTRLFPSNWMTLPIAFGILMSPWGGHSVFPNIYRDMRHPYKYRRAVNTTYMFTFGLDLLMAVVGLLMFGDGVADEITKNILSSGPDAYPAWMGVLMVVCVAIIPLTKVPLNARPIVSTLELVLGLDPRALPALPAAVPARAGLARGLARVAVRILAILVFVLLAILVPQFDTIMSLLGAVACFAICLILPCAFHLKLFAAHLTPAQKARDWALIVVSAVLALLSTAFNFIPKERLGM